MRIRPIFLGIAFLALALEALASPTMIRLGYGTCAACHISPQGGGLLTTYGRAVDEAQSRRAGEYRPSANDLVKALQWGGRISQDLRFVAQNNMTWASQGPTDRALRSRLLYRNSTALSQAVRASATIRVEDESAPRPALSSDPPARPSTVFVNTALLHYRPAETLEFGVGRDHLPSGVNMPDLGMFVRSHNRLGDYDAPMQLKMFWWGARHQITPFVYRSGSNMETEEREGGVGTLAEFDLFGAQKTIVGVSVMRGSARNGDRRQVGAYVRLGFGRWGVLAEHDVTDRTRAPEFAVFRQTATYGQVFWAAREWLVASASGERLSVGQPYEARLVAAKVEIAARLMSQLTISGSGRLQHDPLTRNISKSVAVQAAIKTVN